MSIKSCSVGSLLLGAYLLQTGARSLQKIVHDATYHAFKKVTDDFGKYSKVIIPGVVL